MTLVYVALGSNLGDSRALVQGALDQIGQKVRHFRASNLYQTEPVDCEGGPFINAVCSFEGDLEPLELLSWFEGIERAFGKWPKAKNQARLLDLDLLFYGSRRYNYPHLTIPHPRWQERLFVVTPLRELIQIVQVEEKLIDLETLEKELLCKQ